MTIANLYTTYQPVTSDALNNFSANWPVGIALDACREIGREDIKPQPVHSGNEISFFEINESRTIF